MKATAIAGDVAPVRLAELIRKAATPITVRCKTCVVLDMLTADDRSDFTDSASHGIKAPVLARAISVKMRLLAIDGSLGAASVRDHLRHVA